MGETIRRAIERQYQLKKAIRPLTIMRPDATGLRVEERPASNQIFYCPVCHGPVVDSPQARLRHGQTNARCLDAMERRH